MNRNDWRIFLLFTVAALLLADSCRRELSPDPIPIDPDSRPPMVAELIAAHNTARGRQGIPPLTPDPRLQRAAQNHADHMARVGRIGHSDLGDGSHVDRIRAEGYASGWAGENVAGDFRTVPSVMAGWMGSPGHRINILRASFTDIGAAFRRDQSGKLYWCAVFAAPNPPMSLRGDARRRGVDASRHPCVATPEKNPGEGIDSVATLGILLSDAGRGGSRE